MKAILVTGSTGFLGSEFIAEALSRGIKVIALARNNDGECRVSSVLNKILKEKLLIIPNLSTSLITINFDGDWVNLLKNLKATEVDFEAVYHLAANMSYSPSKVVKSFEVNQKQSVELYQFINDHFPTTRHFFYISTAFTAGINPPSLIKEELHTAPELINSYQMSKWAAEISLSLLSKTLTVPLTIIRPSIIVGDRHTGRYSGKDFGFYMFIKAFLAAKSLGIKTIHLDMLPNSSINIISVKDVVDSLLLLGKGRATPPAHIIHLTCENGTKVSKVAQALKEAWDFDLIFAPPVTVTDKIVDKQIKPNKEFAQFGKWNFEVNAVKNGPYFQAKEFSTEELKRMFVYYEKHFSTGLKVEAIKNIFNSFAFKHKRKKK